MKKLTLFFLSLLAFGLGFQACDDGKTYAEMLDEEKDGINDFIKKENIKVISQTEFYAQDSTTNVEENEYVQLASGVYMQIVDKGSENAADTVKNNDEVLVRFMEYSILDKDTTLSNLNAVETVDAFRYAVTSSSIAGIYDDLLFITDSSGRLACPVDLCSRHGSCQTDCSFQDGTSDSHAICLPLFL